MTWQIKGADKGVGVIIILAFIAFSPHTPVCYLSIFF